MGYSLQDDFDYVQGQLAIIISSIGIDINNIGTMTLDSLLEACSLVYGPAAHANDSPNDSERYAELRRIQQSLKRFWYLFHVLKWRINNE